MKQLYLECNTGISGDMFVAAMLDLGADENVLKQVLATIPVSGFEVKISRVKKMGLSACDFDVLVDHEHENYDHDMEYLYGDLDGAKHECRHEEHEHHHGEHDYHGEHAHHHGEREHHHEEHEHHHDRHEYHHHHAHRGLAEVMQILDATQMTEGARTLSKRIFTILGEAEAAAHGATLETVHFHEVGAVDSIVDIIAAAVCVDNLGVRETFVPVLYEGNGRIRCQHGILPVPVPAVANIVAKEGLKLHITERQGELVTPTGAAIAAAIRTGEKLPKDFRIIRIGLGAGKRNYESPSIVRAMLIESERDGDIEKDVNIDIDTDMKSRDFIYKLESNIDDCTGEALGYVMERLLAAGARDVHYTPVYMKKSRPAYQLNVICNEEDIERLEEIIFYETTTIGIRRMKMERTVMQRELRMIQTELGEAQVKVCSIVSMTKNGRMQKYYPEYDSVAALAKKTGRPFREVYDIVANAAEQGIV